MPAGKPKAKLTLKQTRFIEEYLVDLNATQAAIRAGYSKKTATVMGSENLRKPYIAAAIQEAQAKLGERTKVTQERVIAEYAKLAFLNPKAFFNEDGDLIAIHELPDDVAAAVAGMDVSEIKEGAYPIGSLKKIKFADKNRALDSLGRHLGLFIDKTEITGDVNINLIDSYVEDDE